MEFYPRPSGGCFQTEFLTLSKVQRKPAVSGKCSSLRVSRLVSDSASGLGSGSAVESRGKGKPPNEKGRTALSIQSDDEDDDGDVSPCPGQDSCRG